MCIVFKMRDRVNLAGRPAREDLANRIGGFTAAYRNFQNIHPDLKNAAAVNAYF